MIDLRIQTFDRLVGLTPPKHVFQRLDTACVLGGSIAGLLAARVLAGHARRVLIVEPDEAGVTGRPRNGVPHDRQLHGFLPGGQALAERWLPGLAQEVVEHGGLCVDPARFHVHVDGAPQRPAGGAPILQCSRPLLEAGVRRRVLALPQVEWVPARATGLEYRGEEVCAVRCAADGGEYTVDTDFVVDAMGRASKLSDWVAAAGFDRPGLERMPIGVRYATAVFERVPTPAFPDPAITVAQYPLRPGPAGVAAGLVLPIEEGQSMVGVATMGDRPPITSVEELRSVCAHLPAHFQAAAGAAVSRDVVTFHQADSRRRSFTGLGRFPARLVGVGDAVASFNAIYSQGMSSAALHASCLSEYLTGDPDLSRSAARFFDLQEVAVDALWSVSAGGDAARADTAAEDAEAEPEAQRQRWAMAQLMQASRTDATVAEAVGAVSAVLAHPLTLAEPRLLERAITVNQAVAATS